MNTVLASVADSATLYSRVGRPWIPPEQLLRALLLRCHVRSDAC